jgi:hypothetical protein
MRLIAHSFLISIAQYGLQVKGQHTGARLAGYLKEGLDCFDLTHGRLLGIATHNTSAHCLMTRELKCTPEASAIEWPALRKHKPYRTRIIHLAFGAFINTLGVKGHTKSLEAHERNEQFGENKSTDIGKSQRLRKEGNASINKVSAMRPGLAKIIEKVRISTYLEWAETDIQIAEIACCIDPADTWSPKRVEDYQTAKVRIAVLPIVGSKTHWNSTLELLQRAYR